MRAAGVQAEAILTRALKLIGVLLIVAMLVVVCLGVVTRYMIHYPIPWTDEAARFLLVWTSFLGAAIAVRECAHFEIDLLAHWLSPRARRAARGVAQGAVLALGLALLQTGTVAVGNAARQMSPALQISMAVPYFSVPFSGALIALYVVLRWLGIPPRPPRGKHADEGESGTA